MLPDWAPYCSSCNARALPSQGLVSPSKQPDYSFVLGLMELVVLERTPSQCMQALPRRHCRTPVRTCTIRAEAEPRRRKESQVQCLPPTPSMRELQSALVSGVLAWLAFSPCLCLILQLFVQLGRGKRRFSKLAEKQITTQKHQRELDEMKRLIPDRLNDPLLNVGASVLVQAVYGHQYELVSGAARPQAFAPASDPTRSFRLAIPASTQSN